LSGVAAEIGNIEVGEVWNRLKSDPKSMLIDVRTRAEWAFVGLADLSEIGKTPVLIEWQVYPSNEIDPQFVKKLSDELANRGADLESDLFFVCRSGQRSFSAASVMAEAGYKSCHNVADGFEGPMDGDQHRGMIAGWKAKRLPWAQS